MVMTLRAQHRRISPRAVRRCRAIKEFFRRKLGNSSQQDEIKINSSIVNVTDLKHKIGGIEDRLNAVNQHCRDLQCLETNIRKETEHLIRKSQNEVVPRLSNLSIDQPSTNHTKVLYEVTGEPAKKFEESDYTYVLDTDRSGDQATLKLANKQESQMNKQDQKYQKQSDANTKKRKTRSNSEEFKVVYSNSSFHSYSQAEVRRVQPPRQHHRRKHSRQLNASTTVAEQHEEKGKEQSRKHSREDKLSKSRKRSSAPPVDDDFIAEIINTQYRPRKLFGARRSEISQFSAPVCRDQEHTFHDNVVQGEELCSCCCRRADVRRGNHGSVCDTRLYSAPRRQRHRRRHIDVYNDSAMYDLVPVKEKSSPKTRRKFVEENTLPCDCHKEVPPSPRTLRPRLNLKAQLPDCDDYVLRMRRQNRRRCSIKPIRQHELYDTAETDATMATETIEIVLPRDNDRYHAVRPMLNKNTNVMSSISFSQLNNDCSKVNNDVTSLNNTQDTDICIDKTDKTLCEIKNILQSFLLEIKKDSRPTPSLASDCSPLGQEKLTTDMQGSYQRNGGLMGDNNNNMGFAPHGAFTNPCCYQVLPVCPINCMQSGYVLPSSSFTCCGNVHNDRTCHECLCKKKDTPTETIDDGIKCKDTDDLIREIYNFVAKSPDLSRKIQKEQENNNYSDEPASTLMTSRSVGGNTSRTMRNDANVGTAPIKYYSKSCEAIRSRTNTYYTSETHSDTVMDRLSLEVSQSTSELSTVSTVVDKGKKVGRLAKVLQSFFKKKKKAKSAQCPPTTTTDHRETSGSTEADANSKTNRSYQQEVINYTMHDQEYCHPPFGPYPPGHKDGPYGYVGHEYEPRASWPCTGQHRPYYEHLSRRGSPSIYEIHQAHRRQPSAPPYPYSHDPRRTDPRYQDPRHQDPLHQDPRHQDPRHQDPRYQDPRYQDPRYQDPRYQDHRYDPRYQDSRYHDPRHNDPQMPVCLKEIEVKSAGTQSERKFSFFRKFSKPTVARTAAVRKQPLVSNETQTIQQKDPDKKSVWVGWTQKLQEKIREMDQEPLTSFDLNISNKFVKKDTNMRKKLLDRIFNKKFPLSPKNALMNSLLGAGNPYPIKLPKKPPPIYMM